MKQGDLAYNIASALLPEGVGHREKMAMVKYLATMNPEAFAGGDVNRMRAGATLELPSTFQRQGNFRAYPARPSAAVGGFDNPRRTPPRL